jgi:uroporphyrinogen decarboxylase
MDHRERVLAAINHEEPDYIPIALWGSSYGVTDPLYFDLVKALDLGNPLLPFRRNKDQKINYYDDRILEALDIDVRHIDIGFTDLGGPTRGGGRDAWGIRYDETNPNLPPVEHPLQQAGLEELQNYTLPALWKYLLLDEFPDRAKYLKEKTDYAVVGRAVDIKGPFERCCALRQTEQFLQDLAMDDGTAASLITRVTDVLCKLIEILLSEAGQYLDVIELPGDNYAGTRPFISPRTFDHYFAPSWKRMIDQIHQAAPQCKILFHSNGVMEPFLDRLISLGVDAFHGLEPLPGVDFNCIKEEYGTRMCFWGGIDVTETLNGDDHQVTQEVKTRIHQLGKDGGYILAPVGHLQASVPVRNLITLFKSARELGKYPIQ